MPALVRGHPGNLQEGAGQGGTGGSLPCSIWPRCDEQDPEEAGKAATRKSGGFPESPELPWASGPTRPAWLSSQAWPGVPEAGHRWGKCEPTPGPGGGSLWELEQWQGKASCRPLGPGSLSELPAISISAGPGGGITRRPPCGLSHTHAAQTQHNKLYCPPRSYSSCSACLAAGPEERGLRSPKYQHVTSRGLAQWEASPAAAWLILGGNPGPLRNASST